MKAKVRKRVVRRLGKWEPMNSLVGHPAAPEGMTMAWRNDQYSVQRIERHGLEVLMIRRHDGGKHFPWPHLQAIKDELAGKNREAVQVFPRQRDIVDAANMAHLWLVPEGEQLPYTFARLRGDQ